MRVKGHPECIAYFHRDYYGIEWLRKTWATNVLKLLIKEHILRNHCTYLRLSYFYALMISCLCNFYFLLYEKAIPWQITCLGRLKQNIDQVLKNCSEELHYFESGANDLATVRLNTVESAQQLQHWPRPDLLPWCREFFFSFSKLC